MFSYFPIFSNPSESIWEVKTYYHDWWNQQLFLIAAIFLMAARAPSLRCTRFGIRVTVLRTSSPHFRPRSQGSQGSLDSPRSWPKGEMMAVHPFKVMNKWTTWIRYVYQYDIIWYTHIYIYIYIWCYNMLIWFPAQIFTPKPIDGIL